MRLDITNSFCTLFKQKANTLLNKYEDPKKALDYSSIRQITEYHLNSNSQKNDWRYRHEALGSRVLDEQARCAIESTRELLALERMNTRLQDLSKQITEIETEHQKLEDTERRLYTKVEGFNSKKDVIIAQFSAAKDRVRENLTGISEEMVNVGMATSRTEDKTEKMKAKAQSLEKMIDSGILTDYTSAISSDDIEGALQKMTVKSSVEELAKLRASNDKKQQAQPEINKETTVKHKTDEQEEPVVAE